MKSPTAALPLLAFISLIPGSFCQTAPAFDCVNKPPCTVTLTEGNQILQAAIDGANPGDVICLTAGTYLEGVQVNIDKPLTIRGPKAEIDPRPVVGSIRSVDANSEAIIDGQKTTPTVLKFMADDVILEGVVVRQGSKDMLYSDSPIKRCVIRFCVITEADDEGIQLRDCEDCVIEYNHIVNIDQDGINLCCGSTNGKIRYNEVHNIGSDNAAIYVYDATFIEVTDNIVYDVTKNDGIKMGASCSSAAPNGKILRNEVYNTAQDAITVYSSSTEVANNEIYGTGSQNGALYVACNAGAVTIQRNLIRDNVDGSGVGVLFENDLDGNTMTVLGNCIQNNGVGLRTEALGIVTATANWWGDASGPNTTGVNTTGVGGSGDSVETSGVAGVDVFVDGFLTMEPDDCGIPAPGFIPACPEICDDDIDNDGDGYVDCDDLDCLGEPPCLPSTAPSTAPSTEPSVLPSESPSATPSESPTSQPSTPPSAVPSTRPTSAPSSPLSLSPTDAPPSSSPTELDLCQSFPNDGCKIPGKVRMHHTVWGFTCLEHCSAKKMIRFKQKLGWNCGPCRP